MVWTGNCMTQIGGARKLKTGEIINLKVLLVKSSKIVQSHIRVDRLAKSESHMKMSGELS